QSFAITLGVPFEHSRWFRGREATKRTRSACPDGEGCGRPPAAPARRAGGGGGRPPAALAERWEGNAWPSARAHSHILAAMPAGSFPGVDDADIYEFLDQHARDERGEAQPFSSPRPSSALSWIFCSVSTRLASARAVRSAARRSRNVGFLLVRGAFFERLNKPMIPSFRPPAGRPLAARGLLPAWRASMSLLG